jgi:hypothetical protein
MVTSAATCHDRALRIRGRCADCGDDRVLPGLRTDDDVPICTDCAGFTTSFRGEQVKYATAFLGWLAGNERTLKTCNQANIDTWHAHHSEHDRSRLRGFLLWCMASKLTRQLRLPTQTIRRNAPLPQRQRIDLLGRLLADPELPLRARVAGIIVLLYAQPVTRIVRLTVDDVIRDEDQVLLRLGEPPSPVPGPAADLLLSWIDNRDNMNTATNPTSN